MKKLVIPIVAILALTAMAIAFSSMTTPAPAKAQGAPMTQADVKETPDMSCCEKEATIPIADEKEDCTDCDEAKKADCTDCTEAKKAECTDCTEAKKAECDDCDKAESVKVEAASL